MPFRRCALSSHRMGLIAISISYFFSYVFAALILVMANRSGISLDIVAHSKHVEKTDAGLNSTPMPDVQTNGADQALPMQKDTPVFDYEHSGMATDSSENKPRPMSLAEIMFGNEPNNQKSTSQEENSKEENLKKKTSPENEEKEQHVEKMRALLLFIILALFFIMIQAMLNGLILKLAMRYHPAYVFDWMKDQAVFLGLETIVLFIMIVDVNVMGAVIFLMEICSRFHCFMIANRLYYFMGLRRACKRSREQVIVIRIVRKPKSEKKQTEQEQEGEQEQKAEPPTETV
ncbi:hypothetical protein LSTR_LSTR007766 [Laodelphax striatellus]|uniref:Uncharacterized protein n=1 Tax=Laodelphax striatellus TaxID=195883 RepID=A0A482XSN7_LAOST|nr:hypothetical protein LSTR_LSTR007766 [Laodelphax striatellus]